MTRLRVRAFIREKIFKDSLQDIFFRIYQKNSWGNKESISGDGSNITQTTIIRKDIAKLVKKLNINSLLDAPCGDFYWLKEVDLRLNRYIGADIVPELVAANERRHGSEIRAFVVLDITKDDLPQSDMILCRDCLVHLPLRAAIEALRNFKRSGSIYLLTTTYPGLVKKNKELMITGNWRPLDLQLPPFSLPKPIRIINEGCTEKGDYKEKSLCLWKLTECQI